MAKRKAPLEESPIDIDFYMTAFMEAAKKQYGDDNVFTGKESEARLVGLYLPALCLRYLYQCNIMPLSRLEQITGTQESCKSAFLYEKYRWIRCHSGLSFHIENESKDSQGLRDSILNYDDRAINLYISDSLETWQKYLTDLLGTGPLSARTLLTDAGLNKTRPVGFGLDSLTAKSSREIQDKMDAVGFADRVHPVDALKLSSYLKVMPQKLIGWPFWFGCINHLKPQKTGIGSIDYHTPGGYSIKFQETFEVRLQRIGDIDSGDNGVLIKFVTQKNSLGPGRKTITAAMRWFNDPVTGQQRTYWDWHAATIELLDKGLKTGALRTACQAIVDIRTKSTGGKRVWSKALDIPESDQVPYSVAGEMLEKRPDLIAALHKVLGIREYGIFKPGVDYSQQLKEATAVAEIADGYAPEFREGEEIIPDDDDA